MVTTPRPEFAVGWFTLALINAGLAQSKGKSGLFWFLLSVLLGPFATFFLVAVLDRGELSPREKENIIKEMKTFLLSQRSAPIGSAEGQSAHSDAEPAE